MNSKQRFVLKPCFNNLSEYRLNYKDILTYVTVRSFYNSTDKYCYPSYQTLAKRSGLSKKFIAESVQRLECASLLDIWRVGKVRIKHCYKFNDDGQYQKIPLQIFDETALTSNEKGILLLLREYCNSMFECSKSISEISTSSGLTYRTIHRQFKSLILKGYVVEVEREDPLDKTIEKLFKLTDKLNWSFNGGSTTDINRGPKPPLDVNAIIAMHNKMVRQTRSNTNK